MAHLNRKLVRSRIHRRIRKKINGTGSRPRLAVHFSNKNIYAQVIDDEKGQTIAAASTTEKGLGLPSLANEDNAAKIGSMIADRAIAANVEAVIFDRGGHLFHGKVKALAEAARAAGLKF